MSTDLASEDSIAATHEFTFSNGDFTRVQKLIYQRAGISLHDGKRAMVYSRACAARNLDKSGNWAPTRRVAQRRDS